MYKLRKGVVLFRMFGEDYIYPSRSANLTFPFLITAPPELAAVLRQEITPASLQELSAETQNKLQSLIRLGVIEEC